MYVLVVKLLSQKYILKIDIITNLCNGLFFFNLGYGLNILTKCKSIAVYHSIVSLFHTSMEDQNLSHNEYEQYLCMFLNILAIYYQCNINSHKWFMYSSLLIVQIYYNSYYIFETYICTIYQKKNINKAEIISGLLPNKYGTFICGNHNLHNMDIYS